ncbi:hypothetical protein DCAR_0623557 [Daucus carota subsp. sativus]|uniref:DUF659 domain-containing protein n=1 Tax=Daucus carota subsp. sativus TaxID=79200 RepID=A0AAF0XBY5_DAUCS|nr:hypothetical protein DCAR_0623557 [Daucus carota subsp. sativus]
MGDTTDPTDPNYDPFKDPKRKAKSTDPGWKYGFWPDLNNKNVVQCNLCKKNVCSGVRRLKQHLAGGYPDVAMCLKTTTAIQKEMKEYIDKVAKKPVTMDDDMNVDDDEVPVQAASTAASNMRSQEETTSKRKNVFQIPATKSAKSISSMIRKTPEEVVEERHNKGPSQTTIENCTKSEEEKDRVKMHIANFFYECGIPFNAANSRSYEIMVESIGQFGPGLKPPSYHELRVPLLEKAKKETDKLRERHEKAWRQYGCTLMSDRWSDKRGRHLINFLVNSPEGTFFLKSVDVSSEIQDAVMLANLFEKQIDEIGRDIVVQVVTDNGANFKAAGGLLCRRIPTLYWTPCAAHCLDLMLEDIAKLKEFDSTITHGRNITTFVYRQGRLLSAMREKTLGIDLVRTAATRFATAFLTLQRFAIGLSLLCFL